MRFSIRRRALAVGAILFVYSAGSIALAQRPAPAAPAKSAIRPELSAADVFAKSSVGVVMIETPTAFGSGVVVSSDGLVITNLHVIEDATSAKVKLANGDVFDSVKVAAVDPRRDLALLRIPGFGLPVVELADSDSIRVGDRVYAIGTPKGLELSLSEGLVSAIRDSGDGYQVIQTTAAISSGSSGGGLFDSRGALLGITSFKIRGGENLNFALPVNYVRGLVGVAGGEPMTLESVRRVYGPKKEETPVSTNTSPPPGTRSTRQYRFLRLNDSFGVTDARQLVDQIKQQSTASVPASFQWIVEHDHSLNFSQSCRGNLIVESGRLQFISQNASEHFDVSLGDITEVQALSRFGAFSFNLNSHANRSSAPTAPSESAPRTEVPQVPRLEVAYRSAQSGASLLVVQRGDTARLTVYDRSYAVVGHAVVTWDQSASAFIGDAEITYVCGSIDTRTTTVTSRIEFYPLVGGALRERYNRATGLNCDRGQVRGWSWGEDKWWPR